MRLEILMSAMFQNNTDIVKHSRVTGDILIINQCDENNLLEISDKIRMISTTERGLSRSRNMALRNALGDVCLFADDDEEFAEDYEAVILNAFAEYPDADLIAFSLNKSTKKFSKKVSCVGYLKALKLCSCQVAFRRDSILKNNIQFDETMGAGTGNGGGEENKFLFDCLRKGLKIYFVPQPIATLLRKGSSWFKGYTDQYFLNSGWAIKRVFNHTFLAILYCFYFSLFKYSVYKQENSLFHALYWMIKGVFLKRERT